MVKPNRKKFESELQYVLNLSEIREDRVAEIFSQIGGLLPYFGQIVPLNTSRTAATIALMDIAAAFSMNIYLRFKFEMGCLRPNELNPHIQPIAPTPGHGAYPMGHAVEAYMLSYILTELIRKQDSATADLIAPRLNSLAYRVSFNRIVAGVHFPVDLFAGRELGLFLGRYFISKANAADSWNTGELIIDTSGRTSTDLSKLENASWEQKMNAADPLFPCCNNSGVLSTLYKHASHEWNWLKVHTPLPPLAGVFEKK